MIQIDIARLLAHTAGHLLSYAYDAKQGHDTQKESEYCIQTVILFQAAMEAIVNEELLNHPLLEEVRREDEELNKHYKSLSFKNKWKKVYEVLQIRETEYLEMYLRFYSTYRVPITHPKSRYISVSKYSYNQVYKGLENGWYTVQLMYAILGKDLTSWEEFCRTLNITTG